MGYWYGKPGPTPTPMFKGSPAAPAQQHPFPEGLSTVVRVGDSRSGFDPNWVITLGNKLSLNRITPRGDAFLCAAGEYLLLRPWSAYHPGSEGEVYYCREDGIEHVGTLKKGDYHSVGDIVTGHHDPEALRRRLIRRRDLVDFWQPRDVTLTPRNGPLRDLAPGDRFILSWGEHAEVVEQGPRSTRFQLCDADPDLPSIQLSSRETQIVTCRKGERGLPKLA